MPDKATIRSVCGGCRGHDHRHDVVGVHHHCTSTVHVFQIIVSKVAVPGDCGPAAGIARPTTVVDGRVDVGRVGVGRGHVGGRLGRDGGQTVEDGVCRVQLV